MRRRALVLAVVTTLLWSGSYIVNKFAFAQGIGPLTLSGLRYTLGGLALAVVLRRTPDGKTLPWRFGVLQGFVCYFLGQGMQYIAQSQLTPTLASLMLNAGMVLFIVAADRIRLHEAPGRSLYAKIALLVAGMAAYYAPFGGKSAVSLPLVGVISVVLAAFGSAMNVVCNRRMLTLGVERRSLTLRPMLVGGAMMLCLGLATETLPVPSWGMALCVGYLAFISGALGFALWVYSQQALTAVESGAINNAMLIEIAILDVLFFGRELGLWQWAGIAAVFAAITLLQIKRTQNT